MEYRYRLKTIPIIDQNHHSQTQPFLNGGSTADAAAARYSSSSSEQEIINQTSPSEIMPTKQKTRDWKKDKFSILLLLFLYLLQGIPLGMAASIPLILHSYGTSWSQQATFSFAFYPFSLKLLWAPIVDAIYVKRFGRRKSWLIPTQYLIGLMMIIVSYHINDLLFPAKDEANQQPHVYTLTGIFFGLSFLAATQDICVDGWAISMLSRENVGWASICNSVGQTAGFFLGNSVFLALESKDFADRFIRKPFNMELQTTGLVTIPGFLFFWGIAFAIATTFVALMKHETDERNDSDEPYFGLVETYQILVKILFLPSVWSMATILLTFKVGFAATDAMTGLELIERGVTKDSIALLAVPLIPLQLFLPFAISKYTTGRRPLNIYLKSYPFRLLVGILLAVFVYSTPFFQRQDKTFPWYYYALAILVYSMHQLFLYSMFVSQMAFFAKISDPKIGGTYMTLLNTLGNIGSVWITTVVLFAADCLTWKKCSLGSYQCQTIYDEQKCEKEGGVCQTFIDAYYIEVTVCTIAGVLWFLWKYRTLKYLQSLPVSEWQIRKDRRKSELTEDEEDDEPLFVSTA